MLSKNAQAVIEQGNSLLPAKRVTDPFDLQEKSATLLLITAKLAMERRILEGLLLRAVSVEKATYAQSFDSIAVKTVGEKQLKTDAHVDVLKTKEETGDIKADVAYLTTMIDIFKNAHLLYRQNLKSFNEDV